jgi:hypothetical protein
MTTETYPWGDLKVAFACDDPDALWAADAAQKLPLPEGWALNETDCSGARCVAIFRVDVLPTVADGEAVCRAISESAA